MDKLTLLNIPNYYSSFYHLGLNQVAKLQYSPQPEFAHLNGKPFLVFDYNGKIVVIENDDPIGVDKKSYELCDLYFATNKLKEREDYNWEKVKTIFPHYSVNNYFEYMKLFGLEGVRKLGLKEFVRQVNILYRRPKFFNYPFEFKESNYMFFSGSIWKKEPWANQIRKTYIEACKDNSQIVFEGGMVRRKDGDPCGMPDSVLTDKFPAVEFSEKSRKSIIGFNNPAVLDAVSWRLAEYLNYSCFVISFDFKIDIPVLPVHGKEMHFIQDPSEFAEVIDYALKNPDYRLKISKGGKEYFNKYYLPDIQAKRILKMAREL